MAKRYDPIMCMLVDEPTKAQDAKVKDKLVKVPDNKLKDFEANLRSAGFKVVSKSDRGKSTHYQVEVNSSKQFTEADLREWANKIDAICNKMDSVAPTTWNIGLTADGKITAGLDVREMYVKDSASALDNAIKTCDAVDVDRISNYLWLWVEGREVASLLFNEGLDKYSGPHDKEHKDEAYDFAKKYAQKELDALYSKLKSSVEKKLKEGYANTKNSISGAR